MKENEHTDEPLENVEVEQAEEEATLSLSDIEHEQLERFKKDATEYKKKYLLSIAELENMRKRLQKEKQDMMKFCEERLLLDFIQPIDNLESALSFTDHMSDDTKTWAQGFQMLLNQFKAILEEHNVSSFNSTDAVFDPEKHEAVEAVETDEFKENTIIEVLLQGYTRGAKVIRPARVKVAKRKEKITEETTTTETGE